MKRSLRYEPVVRKPQAMTLRNVCDGFSKFQQADALVVQRTKFSAGSQTAQHEEIGRSYRSFAIESVLGFTKLAQPCRWLCKVFIW